MIPVDVGDMDIMDITYSLQYISGPLTVDTFPTTLIHNNITLPAATLPPGQYTLNGSLNILNNNNYLNACMKIFSMKSTLTRVIQTGPKLILTLDGPFPSINICGDIFNASSMSLLTTLSICLIDPGNSHKVLVYISATSTLSQGDKLSLLESLYLNNQFTIQLPLPGIEDIQFSALDKRYWHRDREQNITIIPANISGLEVNFTISYIFTLTSTEGDVLSVPSVSSSSPICHIQPMFLESGNYSLLVGMKLEDTHGGVSYQDVTPLVSVARAPKPGAMGINASYPFQMPINLSSLTLDLDTGLLGDANITYLWECYTDLQLSTIYNPWVPNTQGELVIPKGYFPIGIYYIKLITSKWNYFTSFTHGVLNISNTHTKLEISSHNFGNLRSQSTSTFKAETIGLDNIHNTDNYSFDWIITPSIFNRYQVNNILTIPRNSLIGGGSYTLNCLILPVDIGSRRQVESTGNLPVIQIKLEVAMEIIPGALIISPLTGDGLTTHFTVTAQNWQHPTGGQLQYRFSYQILGSTSEIYFTSWEYSNTASNIILPPGKDVFYNIVEIKTEGRTAENVTSSILQNITVKPIIITDKKSFVTDILSAAITPVEKLASVSNTAFLVEEDVEYVKEDACGGCQVKHGSCNILTLLCLCHSDYNNSPYCHIHNDNVTLIQDLALILADCIIIYIYIYSNY